MRYSPRTISIACNHRGFTHFGGVYFFHELLRVLHFRNFLATRLTYTRRNHRYQLSQMILALVSPIVLGLDRTWEGSVELLDTCFANVPPDIRQIHVRADAGFGFHPVFEALESRPKQYAVVARLTQAFRRLLPGLGYEFVNRDSEMADLEHRPHGWPRARRFVVARRFIPEEEAQTTLFALGRYAYRAWVTNLPLTPLGVWHFYDHRATMELRIAQLREDYALRKIPTRSFQANALYLEIIRLAYNLVTAFQRTCLDPAWQTFTLQKLRFKLFLLPGEITRPQNRSRYA